MPGGLELGEYSNGEINSAVTQDAKADAVGCFCHASHQHTFVILFYKHDNLKYIHTHTNDSESEEGIQLPMSSQRLSPKSC